METEGLARMVQQQGAGKGNRMQIDRVQRMQQRVTGAQRAHHTTHRSQADETGGAHGAGRLGLHAGRWWQGGQPVREAGVIFKRQAVAARFVSAANRPAAEAGSMPRGAQRSLLEKAEASRQRRRGAPGAGSPGGGR